MGNDELASQNQSVLKEEISHLAEQLFSGDAKESAGFINRLWDTYTRAKDKDFLLIHNPGGWGSTPLENCLQWERSVVEGVSATMEQLGHSWLLTQYFRGGSGWWAHMRALGKEGRFFFGGISPDVEIMATELRFITQHIKNIKVILVAASQGAAFSNAVMRQLGECLQVYSIELGIFFRHMSRRVITDRTLAIDSNGLVPDPMSHRNLWVGFKAYITAPIRWVKYQLQGRPEKFTYCINAPGHDYSWEYPEVRKQITDFLTTNFGAKSNSGGGVS